MEYSFQHFFSFWWGKEHFHRSYIKERSTNKLQNGRTLFLITDRCLLCLAQCNSNCHPNKSPDNISQDAYKNSRCN